MKKAYYTFLTAFLFVTQLIYAVPLPHDPFIIHTIPRCGTHYLERIVSLLTDKQIYDKDLSENALKVESKTKIIRSFKPYDDSLIFFLKKSHFKIITIHRDPRDALVSHLFHLHKYKGQKRDFFTVSENFDNLSFDDQLTALITGSNGTQSYLNFYKKRILWSQHSYCLSLKFEDLIGNEGGGSDSIKEEMVMKIASYINMPITDEKLEYVLNEMYKKRPDIQQGVSTYVSSSIGNWKTFFNKEHKKLFKKHCGKLLIFLGYEKDNNW